MKVLWDESKRLTNLAKHGLDFADLDTDFFAAAMVSRGERNRFVAVGEYQTGIIVTVVFKPLGVEALSVISLRPASRKERRM
ncbi:MAG: BrnT family toxin [Roseiarcus sp.]